MSLENVVKNNSKNLNPNSVPKILHERLLINEDHRKILNAIDELSPRNNSNLYMLDFSPDQIPSLEKISQKTGFKENDIRQRISDIKKIWKIPDQLPTASGKINNEQALIYALANQHRTRYDKNINDYRVTTIQIMTGEVGAATLYTREKSFKGEEIIREALGWNEYLTAYHIQGGHMPFVMQMYGKVKKERAKLAGVSKTEPTQETLNELADLIRQIELAESQIAGKPKKLSEKDKEKITKKVLGTVNTYAESGRLAAENIHHIFKNVNPQTQFFVYSSYNDDANRDEINDQQITKYRMAKDKAEKARKELPKIEENILDTKIELGQEYLNLVVGEELYKKLSKYKTLPKGQEFKELVENIVKENFKRNSPIYEKAKRSYQKHTGIENSTTFHNAFTSSRNKFSTSTGIKSKEDLEKRLKDYELSKDVAAEDLAKLEIKKEEYETYVTTYDTEVREGHGWFTKKVSLNNTEAKGLYVVTKNVYNEIIKKDLFENIRNLVGKDESELNINYISDNEISVYIKDPAEAHGFPIKYKHLPGRILHSIPRVNRQKSNEPSNDSLFKLQKKHESAISKRVVDDKGKPKNMKEFMERKYSLLGYADIALTSYGAGGMQYMVKHQIAHTTKHGEFRGETDIIHYLKVPTRHDYGKLGELMKKGNTGTWEAKRLENGGPTTGFVVFIDHADDSQENIFIHDSVAELIENKYGEEYRNLKSQLVKSNKKENANVQKKIEELYGKVKYDLEMKRSMQTHDLHFGSYNGTSAPSNVDIIKSTQIHVMQKFGLDGIHSVVGTEFVNGSQKWRSYDSNIEGEHADPSTFLSNVNFLKKAVSEKYSKQGLKDSTIDKMMMDYINVLTEQQVYALSTNRLDDQLEMFREVELPIFMELIDKKIPLYIGSGNHLKSSHPNVDESTLIKNMFDRKYQHLGLLIQVPAHGQSYTHAEVDIPGRNGKTLDATITHKMSHGKTEIDIMSLQGLGNKTKTLINFVGDRHHFGGVVEHEKAYMLDFGKQGTNPYVKAIWKAPSARGTAVMGYNADGLQMYSFYVAHDRVSDKIIGWEDTAKIRKEAFDMIKEGKKKAVYW